MVKRTLVLLTLLLTANLSSAKELKCINKAVALVPPCTKAGEVLDFVKGACEGPNMVESVQCRQPGGLMVVKAPVQVFMQLKTHKTIMIETGYDLDESLVALDETISTKDANQAFFHGGFQAAVLTKTGIEVKDCPEAVVAVEVGRGNVLPNLDGREIYTVPTVKSFVCVNN